MELYKIEPCGFCFGVTTAINKILELRNKTDNNIPIYSLGRLIHNDVEINNLTKKGITTIDNKNKSRLELLNEVPNDGIIAVTAHGASPELFNQLKINNYKYIDCTCPKVSLVHKIILKYLNNNYKIIYIGKTNHPESEGTLGLDKNNIILVENKNDIDNLQFSNDTKLFSTNQTTLPYDFLEEMYNHLKNKFPNIEINNKICTSAKERQLALDAYKFLDLLLVVGDKGSSNSKSLYLYSQKLGYNSYFIEDLHELKDLIKKENIFENIEKIGVASGASTPNYLVDEIYNFILHYQK